MTTGLRARVKKKTSGQRACTAKKISLCGPAVFGNNLFLLLVLSFCCGQQLLFALHPITQLFGKLRSFRVTIARIGGLRFLQKLTTERFQLLLDLFQSAHRFCRARSGHARVPSIHTAPRRSSPASRAINKICPKLSRKSASFSGRNFAMVSWSG